jgi:hypothetical protein
MYCTASKMITTYDAFLLSGLPENRREGGRTRLGEHLEVCTLIVRVRGHFMNFSRMLHDSSIMPASRPRIVNAGIYSNIDHKRNDRVDV